jgi:hypothetical protein
VIANKKIVLSEKAVQGNFAGNLQDPIAAADALCPMGYKAMFAHGNDRVASATAFAGDGQVDWVLATWTRYVNAGNELIWKTEDVRLLGVDMGAWTNWAHPVTSGMQFAPVFDGLNRDWTTVSNNSNCQNWTTTQQGSAAYGNAIQVNQDALRLVNDTACYIMARIYCVEQ